MTLMSRFGTLPHRAIGYALDWVELSRSFDALARFRRDFGEFFGRRYVLPLNSGTSANEASVFGLGLAAGDEVICSATSPIFASVPVLAAGAVPVFADVDPRTLIPGVEDLQRRIGPKTRAIVVVHQYGQPAPLDEILALAKKYALKVVEDCAQAHASFYRGKRVGTFGDVMCSSLQQSKHITSGEGGFVATDDPKIYQRALLYSNMGMPNFGYGMESPEPEVIDGFKTRGHWSFGHIHRMSVYQAAVACSQLRRIDSLNRRRVKSVAEIENELRDCPGVKLAHRYNGTEVNYWQYPLRIDPDKVQESASEVVARVKQLVPDARIAPQHEVNYLEHVYQEIERTRRGPHGQEISANVRYQRGMCPNAERAVRQFIEIFVHPSVPRSLIKQTADALRRVIEEIARR